MHNTFIFNEGYGHRGVWHLATSDLVAKTVPERYYEYESDVIDQHTRTCGTNKGRTFNHVTFKYEDGACTCGHTGLPTGEKSISRSFWPETVEYKVPTVACGQISNVRAGTHWRDNERHIYNKAGVHEYTYKREPKKFIFEGEDFPPGPVCSRCRKKLEERND